MSHRIITVFEYYVRIQVIFHLSVRSVFMLMISSKSSPILKKPIDENYENLQKKAM